MTGSTRSVVFPDVPTIEEAGGPKFLSRSWFGLFAPAKTPAAIIDRVATDVAAVSNEPTFKEKYVIGFGLEPLVLGPKDFKELIRKDTAFYPETLSKMKISLD
jgi:tripartite-type tricarboxylate transporter receptor subunit TctC